MLPPSPAAGPDPSGESDDGLDELRDLLDDGVVPEPEVSSDQSAAQPEPSAPQYDKMSTHRTVVAVFIGLNGLIVGVAIGLVVVLGTFAAAMGGGGAGEGLLVIAGILGLGVLVLSTLAAIRFARYGDRGGRVAAWITAVLYVLAFPVGTPIGAYMIWVLTRPNSAPPAPVAQPVQAPAR